MPTYPGLSSEAFKHPLDRASEETLRSVPGFNFVAESFVEYFYERPYFVYFMGNYIQAGPRQYSTAYGLFRECVRDLSITVEPNLFISQNAQVNAYALGHERPSVVLNTGLLDLLSESELRCAIAHELGHVKCNHTVLIQMGIWAMGAAELLGEMTLGLGKAISSGLVFAFYEWLRKAELSADRASLLVMGELEPVMKTMMKLSGGSAKYANEVSVDEFNHQSEQYQELGQDGLNQLYKFLLYNGGSGGFLTHPFTVERLHYVREWFTSEQYSQIRQGNYKTTAEGSVEVDSQESEVERLKRQVQDLQNEIDRARRSR